MKKKGDNSVKPEIEFLKELEVIFGDRFEQTAFQRLPKNVQEDFMGWVGEEKQQTWDYREKGERKTHENYQWWRAWEIYQLEYIQYIIARRMMELDAVKGGR